MSIRITELDAITSLQDGDYVAIDNESNGTHKFKVLDISSNVANNIANNYSSNASYAIGQYCLYNNNLYKCTTTISTPEAWNASHWVQVTVGEGLYDKVDKINGKELSTNDFTNAYKTKLDGIEDGAEVNVQANWTENDSSRDDYIKNKPENATTSTSGFMSASDKQKLDGIEAGAEVNVQPNWAENDSSKDDYIKNKPTIDTALSTSSDNAVRNSAITAGINTVQNNLNAEITAREGAVSAEQTARENTDNALDGRIDTIEEILPNKANINGSYEEMTVGSAEQLISTESMEDSELYIFRKSGNGADIGDRETDMLIGGTVAWNQLIQNGDFTDTSNWEAENGTLTASNNIGKLTATSTSVTPSINQTMSLQFNHKYLVSFEAKAETSGHRIAVGLSRYSVNVNNVNIGDSKFLDTTWHTCSGIGVFTDSSVGNALRIALSGLGTMLDVGDFVSYKNIQVIDLTAMFGTEIADYIYGLEQAEAGKGVAWFRKYFPNPYYAYDAGSLQSVNAASHDMVGKNQFDKSTAVVGKWLNVNTGRETSTSNNYALSDYIPVIAGQTYTITNPQSGRRWLYDSNKQPLSQISGLTFTPTQSGYARFTVSVQTVSLDTIQLEMGSVNTAFEPYTKHTYPLDSSVTLRGQYKLDVQNNLYADGDTYESSGKVTRKYGIVDLGTLDWSNGAAMKMFFTTGIRNYVRKPLSDSDTADWIICNRFTPISYNALQISTAKRICISTAGSVGIVDGNEYSTLADFKAAMSGVYLVYELETLTEEEAEGFTNPQIVDASGTEEYVDAGVKNNTRDVAIPVGHITQYVVNLRDKLQHLPFLAKEDGDYFVNQTGTQMSLKKVEGYYEDLVVGVADNLSTDIRTNDQTPYLFRTSGGSVDIGDREYINSVIGGTIAWNQLANNFDVYGEKGTVVKSGNKYTYTFTELGTNQYANSIRSVNSFNSISGHKYLEIFDVFCAKAFKVSIGTMMDGWVYKNVTANIKEQKSFIVSGNGTTPYLYIGAAMNNTNTFVVGDTFEISNIQVFDLTQMFGSTVADYIYGLEQANAGAGVAFFRSLFPKPYYEYNAGELLSVSGLQSHDMRGFNAWDEEWELGGLDGNTGEPFNQPTTIRSKNFTEVIPNTSYYYYCGSADNYFRICYYAADKSFISSLAYTATNSAYVTPNGCHYIKIAMRDTYGTSYKNDICINLSWDASRDGEYEPYQKWSYPLDSSLVLRGIPKLDSNNNLYYDGDTYESDGTVTRKYGVVDLGSLTWTYKNTSTNPYFATSLPTDFKIVNANAGNPNVFISNGYVRTNGTTIANNANTDKAYVCGSWEDGANTRIIRIADHSYTDATAFKTAMSGVMLVYELATPTTESAEPYTNPQIVDDFGTEEYVIDSTIDVPIPVGHDTDYPINLKSKLEMAPDSPDGDGDYIVRQTNGTNEYVPLIIEDQLPAVPSTDGTYTLTVTIADGEATYSWT